MDKFSALVKLTEGNQISNALWNNDEYLIMMNNKAYKKQNSSMTGFNLTHMNEEGWIDLDNVLSQLNETIVIENKTIQERKEMYIRYVADTLNRIEDNGDKIYDTLMSMVDGDFDKVKELVKNKIKSLSLNYQEGSDEYFILDNLNVSVSVLKLKMETKFSPYDIEMMSKEYIFNYYRKGGMETVSGYGIDILKKLGVPMMPITDEFRYKNEEFITYLNNCFVNNPTLEGHFQNRTNTDKVMDGIAFNKRFNDFDKPDETPTEVKSPIIK